MTEQEIPAEKTSFTDACSQEEASKRCLERGQTAKIVCPEQFSADGSLSKASVYEDAAATAGMGGRLPYLKANPTHIEFELERKRHFENQLLS